MKLTAFQATKTPVLRTKDPPNNQNTPATRTKNSQKGYNFRGGADPFFTQRIYILYEYEEI